VDWSFKRRMGGVRRRLDAGVTLVEMLVGGAIFAIVAVLIAGVLMTMGTAHVKSTAETITLSQLEDASGQLLRDVNDGRRILVASPSAVTVQVLRDSVCTERAWSIEDDALVVDTRTFTTESCTGGSTDTHAKVVQKRFTSPEPFKFYSVLSQRNPMKLPVIPAEVRRVTWDLSALPAYDDAKDVRVSSGAAFTGTGSRSDGTGVQADDALRPLLDVTTERPGVDKPQLTWQDKSPSVTAGWTVYRIDYAEGTNPPTSWSAIMQLPASMTTWTDVSLPAGHTGQYVVVATLTDGQQGPSSNQVSTGLRPAAPTITATGATTSIAVSWNSVTGADSYDVYRDGSLVKVGLTATTWTDKSGEHAWTGSGYGHAHTYNVVAVNRWERAATNPTQKQDQRLALGQDAGATLGLPSAKRTLSNAASAWTAPAAVTGLAGANRLPADQADLASVWDPKVDIDWAASAWVGDYATAAKSATRYAVSRGSTTLTAATAAVTLDDSSAPRGTSSTWTVVPTAGGLTGPSASAGLLTWPSAATCTATLGGGGFGTTRAATVDVTEPAGQTVTGVRHARTSDGTYHTTNPFAWTSLADGTTTSWKAQAKNGAGYGPFGAACSAKTDLLGASLGYDASETTTRAVRVDVSVLVGGTAVSNLDARGLDLETTISANAGDSGADTVWAGVGSKGWGSLVHNTSRTVTSRVTDGYNTATATKDVRTLKLEATLSATGSDTWWIGTSTNVEVGGAVQTTSQLEAAGITVSTTITRKAGGSVEPDTSFEGKGGHTWQPLVASRSHSDYEWYVFSARASDGFNRPPATTMEARTGILSVAAATCVATLTDALAPGALTISGGGQVRLGSAGTIYGGPQGYSGLGAGTYVGYARNVSDDDHGNVYYSGWDACPARTIEVPFTPTDWGKSAPGCYALGVYVTPTSPATWQIRRSAVSTCLVRWVLTYAGANGIDTFEGDVVAGGTYTIGSGASAYTRTSGSGSYPMGPLV